MKKKKSEEKIFAVTQFSLTTFGTVFRRARHSPASNWPHDEVRAPEVKSFFQFGRRI